MLSIWRDVDPRLGAYAGYTRVDVAGQLPRSVPHDPGRSTTAARRVADEACWRRGPGDEMSRAGRRVRGKLGVKRHLTFGVARGGAGIAPARPQRDGAPRKRRDDRRVHGDVEKSKTADRSNPRDQQAFGKCELEWTIPTRGSRVLDDDARLPARGDGPPTIQELIGLGVSGATRCKYCTLFHTEREAVRSDRRGDPRGGDDGATPWPPAPSSRDAVDYDSFRRETLDAIATCEPELRARRRRPRLARMPDPGALERLVETAIFAGEAASGHRALQRDGGAHACSAPVRRRRPAPPSRRSSSSVRRLRGSELADLVEAICPWRGRARAHSRSPDQTGDVSSTLGTVAGTSRPRASAVWTTRPARRSLPLRLSPAICMCGGVGPRSLARSLGIGAVCGAGAILPGIRSTFSTTSAAPPVGTPALPAMGPTRFASPWRRS